MPVLAEMLRRLGSGTLGSGRVKKKITSSYLSITIKGKHRVNRARQVSNTAATGIQ